MFKHVSRGRVISVWFAAVAIAFVASLLAGVAATPSTWALLLLTSLVPPVISFVVWRGAPPLTVAELLHEASEPGDRS